MDQLMVTGCVYCHQNLDDQEVVTRVYGWTLLEDPADDAPGCGLDTADVSDVAAALLLPLPLAVGEQPL